MRLLVSGVVALVGGAAIMTTAALAAPVTYDVDLTFQRTPGTFSLNPLDSATLSGTIMTDGTAGPIGLNNITGQNLTLTTTVGSSAVAFDQVDGSTTADGLIATASALSFRFGGGLAAADVSGNFLAGFAFFSASADPADGITTPYIFFGGPSGPNDFFFPSGYQLQALNSSLIIGTAEGGEPIVSTVPLPASAPMFGAALMSLGAIGYGLKRKARAAAVA